MKLNYSSCLFGLFLLTACTPQGPLSGTLAWEADGNWKPEVYLIDPLSFDGVARSYIGAVIDSAAVAADGSFAFDQLPDASSPVLLQLAVQQKGERYLNKLDHEDPNEANYFPLIWQNGHRIEVSADIEHFQRSFKIKDASPENTAMLELRDTRLKAFDQFLSGKSSTVHDEASLLEAEKAMQGFQQPLIQFASESPHLLPALTAIRWLSIESDYERIPEVLVSQCEKWQTAVPNHSWVAQLCSQASRETLPVLIGDTLPDFPLPMLSGDTIALRKLLAKQLTLLDLWASWCAPCRLQNRNYLVPLWEEYHQEGFQIIGYALDASQKVWQNAIEKDGAGRWLHASHLQGDDAPLFQALRIRTIPANFLIDSDGKVVAKNLHGDELIAFVAEYMSSN